MLKSRSRRFLDIPDEFWIAFIIMVGFFLKLVYDIEVGYTARTANPGVWEAISGGTANSGQIGVIQYYFTYHRFPDFDPRTMAGYGNPPLFYWISALILEIFHRILGWDIGVALHTLQCINVIYVIVGAGCGIGILQKFGVRGRKMAVCIIFLMFFPTYYNLCAALEPAALAFMLSMLTLNTALGWFHSRRNKALVKTAVRFGLGMMTSFATIVILPMLLVLMYEAVTDGRRNMTPLRMQYRRFAVIMAPLSLWWPLYRLIRFGVPITYWDMPYGERLEESFLSRIGLPTMGQLLHLHTTEGGVLESNIWAQTLKTAVTDFQALSVSTRNTYAAVCILLFVTMAVLLAGHLMLIHVLLGNQLDRARKRFIVAGWLSILACYLVVCWQVPWTGTMDFKDIAVSLMFPLIGIGLCGKGDISDRPFERVMTRIVNILIFVMAFVSAFLFGFYG